MSFCIQCGAQLKERDLFCTQCGALVNNSGENTQENIGIKKDEPTRLKDRYTSAGFVNQSGQGKNVAVPSEIKQWNWGAFLLSWIWGIGNNTWIALLVFLPIFNIVMPFVLGAKGSEWAWKNKQWESVEHFKVVQAKWAKWGLIVVLLLITFVFSIYLLDMYDYYL